VRFGQHERPRRLPGAFRGQRLAGDRYRSSRDQLVDRVDYGPGGTAVLLERDVAQRVGLILGEGEDDGPVLVDVGGCQLLDDRLGVLVDLGLAEPGYERLAEADPVLALLDAAFALRRLALGLLDWLGADLR
jgi:hypothetical protein